MPGNRLLTTECRHVMVHRGEDYRCDNTQPGHDVHTNRSLRVEWIDRRKNPDTPWEVEFGASLWRG